MGKNRILKSNRKKEKKKQSITLSNDEESFSRNFDKCNYIRDPYHDKNILRLL